MIALVAQGLFAFKGDDASALVTQFAEKSGDTVLNVNQHQLSPFEARWEVEDGIPEAELAARAVARAVGLSKVDTAGLVAYPTPYPDYIFRFTRPLEVAQSRMPLDKSAFRHVESSERDDLVEFRPVDGHVYYVGALLDAKTPKPLDIHWALRPMAIVAHLGPLPFEDALRRIAPAIGATVTVTETRIKLDVDPKAFRERFLAMLALEHDRTTDLGRARAEFERMAVRSLTDADVAECLKRPNAVTTVPLPQSPEAKLVAQNLLDAYLREYGPGGRNHRPGQGSTAMAEMILAERDRTKPMAIAFGSNGTILLGIPGRQRGHWFDL